MPVLSRTYPAYEFLDVRPLPRHEYSHAVYARRDPRDRDNRHAEDSERQRQLVGRQVSGGPATRHRNRGAERDERQRDRKGGRGMVQQAEHAHEQRHEQPGDRLLPLSGLLLARRYGPPRREHRGVQEEPAEEVGDEHSRGGAADVRDLEDLIRLSHVATRQESRPVGEQEPRGDAPDEQLENRHRPDAEHLAEHQLKRTERRDEDFYNTSRLLFQNGAHHVDAVEEDCRVENDAHEIRERKRLRGGLARGLSTRDLFGVDSDGDTRPRHHPWIDTFSLEPHRAHDVADGPLEGADGREPGSAGPTVLAFPRIRVAVGHNEEAGEPLLLHFGGE